jgi:hypothetical protein
MAKEIGINGEQDVPDLPAEDGKFDMGPEFWYLIELLGGQCRLVCTPLDSTEIDELIEKGGVIPLSQQIFPQIKPIGGGQAQMVYMLNEKGNPLLGFAKLDDEDGEMLKLNAAHIVEYVAADTEGEAWMKMIAPALSKSGLVYPDRASTVVSG